MIEFNPTPDQRANLEKLAAYLAALPADYRQFEMRTYINKNGATPLNSAEVINHCGSVGCAVGHGPAAGVPPLPTEYGWDDYVERAFGAPSFLNTEEGLFGLDNPSYEWMFSGSWEQIDNTPHGAAKRIQIALTEGIPEDWDEQINDEAPLCYAGEIAK